MKVCIKTLGCKVNLYESEMIKEKFIDNNYEITEDEKISDIIIINTCSVTNTADNKSKKIIRSSRRENPKSIIVVCGCSSENNKEEFNDLGIDILIGSKDKSKIVNLVKEYIDNKKKIIKFYDLKSLDFEDMYIKKFNSKTRAFVKIQDGCDNYCSYCVIPFLRGNIRFKEFSKVIEEVNELVSFGHKEIVLTGIHTGSYGRGLKYDLTDLIQELIKINDLKRIRISSIEITEISDKFINLLKNNNKVCHHLHIPLQSGCDKILKLMNRKYSKEEYKNIIDKIREHIPDINITTDIIVGFPNETDSDFEETIKFAKEMLFGKIHVFPYSIRNKTIASKMDNQVPNNIKKERSRKLIEISNELECLYYNKFINKTLNILIEEVNDNKVNGFSSNYIKVLINKKLDYNKIYKVKIVKVNKQYVEGKLVE